MTNPYEKILGEPLGDLQFKAVYRSESNGENTQLVVLHDPKTEVDFFRIGKAGKFGKERFYLTQEAIMFLTSFLEGYDSDSDDEDSYTDEDGDVWSIEEGDEEDCE